MKTSHLTIRLSAGCALPLFLLLAGCKDQNNSTTATDTTATAVAADTNNAVVNADNSGRNVRDRNDMTLTPGDQGGSDTDRQITQKIRQTLVSGTNDFSVTAKNVKIITTNGMVTLRGPVNNNAEKTGIGAIAQNIAGQGSVDNQLEVKSSQ